MSTRLYIEFKNQTESLCKMFDITPAELNHYYSADENYKANPIEALVWT